MIIRAMYGQMTGQTNISLLSGFEKKDFQVPVYFPANGTNGSYYIGIWVDSQNNISEMSYEWDGEWDNNKGGYLAVYSNTALRMIQITNN